MNYVYDRFIFMSTWVIKGKRIEHAISRKRHLWHKQCIYLTYRTHSLFQILYTLLPSLRVSILLRSSFFSFLIFWFQVFPLFTKTDTSFILSITLQALLSDTRLPSHFIPFHFYVLLCTCFHKPSFILKFCLHHSWIKLFKSFVINNLNEKRTFNKN